MKHLKKFESFSQNTNEDLDFKKIGQRIGLVKDPERIKERGLKKIQAHPVYRDVYANLLESDPEKAEKYLVFHGENPDAKYIKWSDKLQNYIDVGISSDPSGILGTKSYNESKKVKRTKRTK